MIVVDANIIVYALTDSPQREVIYRIRSIDGDWRVPILWRHEFLNVMATLIRQRHIRESDAPILWNNAVDLLGKSEHAVNMVNALNIAVKHGISAYDAQYVSLAKELSAFLLTEDSRLLKAFPDIALSAKAFLSKSLHEKT